MSDISRDTVNHVAQLSRIRLTESEVTRYSTELTDQVQYIDQLSKIDIAGVDPILQIAGLENVFRIDAIVPSTEREALLANAPLSEKGFLKVRTVK